MSSPALRVSGLRKTYGSRTVVQDVSLEVHPKEIVGLLGPNGAGKTTTFQMILGLTSLDDGEVNYGESLNGMPLHQRARRGLGYLSQSPSVFRGLSVRDNLLLVLEALHKKNSGSRADALLHRFHLEGLARQKAATLSGGERRRLEFARALCSDPGILLVDEPFAGVDPIAVSGIAGTIRELAKEGIGILMTDHTVRESLETCTRVYLMVEGRIAATGTSSDIVENPLARRLYLGDSFTVR